MWIFPRTFSILASSIQMSIVFFLLILRSLLLTIFSSIHITHFIHYHNFGHNPLALWALLPYITWYLVKTNINRLLLRVIVSITISIASFLSTTTQYLCCTKLRLENIDLQPLLATMWKEKKTATTFKNLDVKPWPGISASVIYHRRASTAWI